MNAMVYVGISKSIRKSFLKTNVPNYQFNNVVNEFSNKLGIPIDDILGRSRIQNIAITRNLCILAVRELTGFSLHQIGYLFNRDHSTIINSLKSANNLISSQKKANTIYQDVISKLQ